MKEKAKKFLLDILIVVLGIVLIVILIIPIRKQLTPSKIKIAIDNSINPIPVLIANDTALSGIFKDRKINATIITVPSPEKAYELLLKDSVDFVFSTFVDGIKAFDKTKDTLKFFMIGTYKTSLPPEGLIVNEDSKITKFIDDLKGKRIGVSTVLKTAVEIALIEAGYNKDDVEIKLYNGAHIISALENKEVDAIIPIEPYFSIAREKGLKIVEAGVLNRWINAPFIGAGMCGKLSKYKKDNLPFIRLREAMDLTYIFIQRYNDTVKTYLNSTMEANLDSVMGLRLPLYERVHEISKEAAQTIVNVMHQDDIIQEDIDIKNILFRPVELNR